MNKLSIQWKELLMGLETAMPEFEVRWFFDKQTGRIVCINEFDDEETRCREERALCDEPERFEEINAIGEQEMLDLMTRFSIEIEYRNLKELLWISLDSDKPNESFLKTIKTLPEAWEDWNYFLHKALIKRATEWLHGLGIEPDNQPDTDYYGE